MQREEDEQCDHRGRYWSYEAAEQGIPVATRNWRGQWRIVLQSLQREQRHASSLMLDPEDSFGISGRQNCHRLNFCCQKPLNMWQFVTTSLRNEHNHCYWLTITSLSKHTLLRFLPSGTLSHTFSILMTKLLNMPSNHRALCLLTHIFPP